MPTLATRRPSLCLFCQHIFKSTPRPRHPLPHTPSAYFSGRHVKERFERRSPGKPAKPRDLSKFGQWSFNPLRKPQKDPITLAQQALSSIRKEFEHADYLDSLNLTHDQFLEQWNKFIRYVQVWIKRDAPELGGGPSAASERILQAKLKQLFFAQVYGGRFTKAELENQKGLANLRYPAEWYPATREISRTVHLHVGPTNSGKTYHALKRLEESKRGIYLGPLRLLAHEVYTRLNAKGKPCALITGEEQRIPSEDVTMWSCTVEMAPLNTELEIAVIDEIQMINHQERGWAWTQAFLGVQAKELHLCGEARTVPLIKQLCAITGDKVVVHNYERLSPLRVANRSLKGKLNSLEKGDCIVTFSVLGIHALRRQIEGKTGKKCAIVYGSLPPETRAQQARLFNDPDNEYDFLVASDAVGMGLNLSIKRVIFETTVKNDGQNYKSLDISDVKQIAGRAGRYRSAHQAITQDSKDAASQAVANPNIGLDDAKPTEKPPGPPKEETVGYATTLEDVDFQYLKTTMERDPPIIRTAGLFPPSVVVERFANYFPPGTPFSYIMLRLHEISNTTGRFHLCTLKDQLAIADVIHPIRGLTIQDRILLCAAPTNARDANEKEFLQELARCIADKKTGDLLELPIPLELLDEKPSGGRPFLFRLEQLHKMLVLYLWVSYRFPNVFTTRALANHTKQLVEDAIEHVLSEFNFTEASRVKLAKQRQRAVKRGLEYGKREGLEDIGSSGEEQLHIDSVKPKTFQIRRVSSN
ncbi:P-loop containing nucleoside triphosphate hydrolase protein [Aaosphaeria arxii CBS 175.79]|uniref:RNA helicase n=1 Tax=Aaosphaeria arxii CBS 175.79 TaxID=1450172 RepID=A0A6A5Y538_9PLEO|nr:P-loop containing nucleoside triphosphate hydrolase protein [Aaosphaeria arxii CBS 175.79]KAF2019961.1 P-loop containing nucleoside triphosphate hydrolase protein [Aaosphaeria arxii CBS 175.79]